MKKNYKNDVIGKTKEEKIEVEYTIPEDYVEEYDEVVEDE